MNLKTLHYNMWHIYRRKLWFPALSFVVFLFALPISVAIQLQRFSNNWLEYGVAEHEQGVSNILERSLSFSDMSLIVLITLAAFAASLCFFHYLHSKKEVDFFHSLPLRRGNLFASHYLAGALAVILPYLINLLLTVLAVTALGCGDCLDFAMLAQGLATHLIYFLAIYSLGVLAAVMTGNSVVQALLAIAFSSIGPLLIGCYQWVRAALQPGWYHELTDWGYLIANSSPAARYFYLNNNFFNSDGKAVTPALFGMLLFIVLIVFAAWFLYRLRPSETTGRALAFSVSRPIIKYPVMLSAMAGFAMIMHEIGDMGAYGWYYLGAALGGFLSAQIMEIIYRFDFQGIRKKLTPMGLVIVIYIGISLFLIEDVSGYNTYVPETDDVAAVDVRIDALSRDAYNDYLVNREADQYPASGELLQVNANEYLLRGHTEDSAAVAATCSIAQNLAHAGIGNYSSTADETEITANIRYYLKNGSVKTRQYSYSSLPLSQVEEQVLTLYADEEFRSAQYALFTYDLSCIRLADIRAYEGEDFDYYGMLKESPAFATEAAPGNGSATNLQKDGYLNQNIAQLLQVYEQELKGLDGEERMHSLAIGELIFYVFASDPGKIHSEDDSYQEKSYRIFTYPVYPQFTETIARLAELGFGNWEMDFSHITSITVDCYDKSISERLHSYGIFFNNVAREDEDEWYNSETFTDSETIAAIMEATVPKEAADINGFQRYVQNCDVYVYIEDAGNGYTNSYYRVFLKD